MWRARFLVAIVAVALTACSTSATTSTNPNAQPTANPTAQAAAALFTCASRTLTWDGKSAVDMTGTWAGDDQGVYFLRQLGDQIWWLGMSGIGGPLVSRGTDWTNVYHGTLAGGTVTGTYADVPGGKIQDNGPVVLKMTSTSGGGISLVRTDPLLSTGFGGTLLTPCTLG
jgi:hypothetical protein